MPPWNPMATRKGNEVTKKPRADRAHHTAMVPSSDACAGRCGHSMRSVWLRLFISLGMMHNLRWAVWVGKWCCRPQLVPARPSAAPLARPPELNPLTHFWTIGPTWGVPMTLPCPG